MKHGELNRLTIKLIADASSDEKQVFQVLEKFSHHAFHQPPPSTQAVCGLRFFLGSVYVFKWAGYEEKGKPTWEPWYNARSCPEVVHQFHTKYSDEAGPS
ncbi:hypothetical protein EJ06DRAFT_415067 [Trichodelitschia bisporula]|uniref:Chromo domain-containing protein n=1 Tax=Trichodelitschia bisporula TaxID=703511 RepID=A0A6G1HY31_9PEZI|nr:hypothetical protein EJ06DRAFT_415067 [Trichodelitschia bisporula]